MSAAARRGDPSTHGGEIVSASSDVFCDGIGVARTGDLHACPIPGHGTTALTGTATTKADGANRVRVGDLAGCGAAISAGSPTVNLG
jgi:uncharacterized Zn-binding protein involved in type VI secretion